MMDQMHQIWWDNASKMKKKTKNLIFFIIN